MRPCINDKATIQGSAIYRISSYLNHSCDPNVMAVDPHLGGHVSAFVAGKRITKDDELFYGYQTSGDVHTRRKKLYEAYHFWCNCPRCQVELANAWSNVQGSKH